MLLDAEQQAIALSKDEVKLLARFKYSVECLKEVYSKNFTPMKKCKLDFENKQFIGMDGYYLQWKVRENPNEPSSYMNQQTSIGCVELMRVRPKDPDTRDQAIRENLKEFFGE